MIRTLHRLGVRMAGLTWNRANAFADGLAEQTGAGITGLGFELLDEMGQLGMALDLSHLSPRGCELALERYGRSGAGVARQRRSGVREPAQPGRRRAGGRG